MSMTALQPVGMERSAIPPSSKKAELSRLITAAVVSQKFCDLLLSDPAMALATGYGGESFSLSAEEQELILSIRATSLADFAMQLAGHRNGNGRTDYHGPNHGLNGHNGLNGYNGHKNGNGVGKAW